MAKRIISVFLVLVMFVSVFSISAGAIEIDILDRNFGYLLPTNSKGTKNLNTVNLYGDYDYINFKYSNKHYDGLYYIYEIYSDKDYKKLVTSGYVEADKGDNIKCSALIKLKGSFKSKTYYGVTYAAKETSTTSIGISPSTVYKFKINVKRTADFDDKVVVLKKTENTVDGAKITWSSLSGANKYYIYRRSASGKNWTKVGSVSKSKTSFTDTSVKNKVSKYIYTVKAINKKGVASRYLYNGIYCYFVRAPKITSVKTVAGNAVEIKWEKANSFRYTVFRKEIGGDWEILHGDFGGTTWTDKTVENGKTYRYTIRVGTNKKYISSYIYENGDAITFLKAPEMQSITHTENEISFNWDAVEGATSYIVMRKTHGSSPSWEELAEVDSSVLEFTDDTADMQKSYSYTVRSNNEDGLGSYDGTGLEYIVLGTPTLTLSPVYNYSPDPSYFKWSSVSSAQGYELYVSCNGGEWELFYSGTSTSIPKYSNVFGEVGTYQFKVRATRKDGNVGEFSEIGTTTYYPTIDIKATLGDDNITVKWGDYFIHKCDYFNLYRKNALDEAAEYELVTQLTGNEYVDTDIQPDGLYDYQVRMVHNDIEQDVCLTSCQAGVSPTLTGKPKIRVENERIFFDDAWKVYGYNFTTESWEQLEFDSEENTKENHSKYCKDGKYRYGFMFKKDSVISVLENNVIDYEWYSVKVKYSISLISSDQVRLKIENPTKEIEKYSVTFGNEVNTRRTDGSKSYSFTYDEYFWSPKKEYSEIKIDAITKNGDISTTTGRYYYMKTPTISEISRKKNGDVKLTIKQYNYDEPDWDGYYIYRKAEGETKWKKIKTLKSVPSKGDGYKKTSYTDTSAKKGVKYTYTVKSYKKYNNETFISYYVKKGTSIK